MKKSFWLWGAAVTVLSINMATAEDFEYRPFIGAEYSYVNGVADGMRPNYNAGSIVVGTASAKQKLLFRPAVWI